MHLCVCGRRLFSGESPRELLEANAECKIDLNLHAFKNFNAAGLELLGKLCSKDPRQRPSARDALGHQWLKQEEDNSADEASGLNQALMDSSQYDAAFHSRSENKPKTHNRSKASLFRSLLRGPRTSRSTTLTKILPEPTSEEHIHPSAMNNKYIHPPLSPHAHRSASGARQSFASRASRLMAWARGKPKQQSNPVSDTDFASS